MTAEQLERLDALAEQMPFATRTGLAREALLMGLDAIEQDPSCLFGRSMPKRGGARKRAGRKRKK